MVRLLILVLVAALFTGCGDVEAGSPAAPDKRISISFDDAPRTPGAFFTPDERADRLIAALRSAGVEQAVFFVNPGNLGEPYGAGGEERLAAYVKAGHVLANHSFSHPRLSASPADHYLADIDRAEEWLRSRPGYRPWFRYPFLDEGGTDKAKRDAVRAGLKARGLRNGYVTAEAIDWNTDALATQAVRAGKKLDMDALRRLFVESHVEAAEFYEGLARRTLGRSPVHTLLLHETDLAAMYVDDLVAALRANGWEIVTADEAYRDPLGEKLPDTPNARGTLIEAIAWEQGLPEPRWYEGNNPRVANALFADQVLKEKQPQ